MLASFGRRVLLSLKPQNGAAIPKGSITGYRAEYLSSEVQIPLNAFEFGQNKHIPFSIVLPENPDPNTTYVRATLQYEDLENHTQEIGSDDKLVESCDDLLVQQARVNAVGALVTIVKTLKKSNLTESGEFCQNLLKTTVAQIKECNFPKDSQGHGLMLDLEGQVTEAISRDRYWTKWGTHYLGSLANAHLHELSNNFKDPGLQFYGGKLFSELRKEADEIFIKLPPPKPSHRITHYLTSMSRYHSTSNGCFHGNCLVHMADGSFKKVKDVRKGDRVADRHGKFATVVCVVKMISENKRSDLVELGSGLLVTPHHPVCLRGASEWMFPLSLAPAKNIPCKAVYDFVLDSCHNVLINGIACITLGHEFSGPVASHEYFGTKKVLSDLSAMAGYDLGFLTFKPNSIERDPQTHLIKRFKKEALCQVEN